MITFKYFKEIINFSNKKMDAPKHIGKYKIECLISNISQRRIFFALDQSKKKFAIKESIENQKESLQKEFDILKNLHHPNVIQTIECFEQDDRLYLVTPRAEIDLYEFMSDQEISDETSHKILNDLFSAISYLGSLNICHRNITTRNILFFKEQNKFVLSGFDNACHFKDASNVELNEQSLYIAPEITDSNSKISLLFF